MTLFTDAIREVLGHAPDSTPPGKLVRFATSDKRGDLNGWARLFDDEEGGAFGCWRQGISETWQARQPLTESDRREFAERVRLNRERAEKELADLRAECRQKSADLWTEATPANAQHPYLRAKGIKPHGVRQIGENLLVPVRGSDGTLRGLQFIGPDGSKKFKTGTEITDNYCSIGKPQGATLLVCEGWATGATLHEATGEAVAVAFNAGNLLAVCETLREKFTDWRLVICADDDHATPGNPGLTKGTEAAVAVGGLLAAPNFTGTERGPKDSDFNDLARLAGLEAVNRCIEAATELMLTHAPDDKDPAQVESVSQNQAKTLAERLRRGSEIAAMNISIAWLILGLIPEAAVVLFFGRGGIGKTTLMMQFLNAISRGAEIFGRGTTQRPVICVDYENSLAVLAERCRNIGADNVLFLDSGSNPPRLDRGECSQYLDLLEQYPGAVFVFDTLRSSQGGDENDSQAMTKVMDFLRRLRDAGATVIVLHHTPKASDRKYKGSGAIFDMADHVLALYPVRAPGDDGEADDDDDAPKVYRFGTSQKTRYEPDRIFLTFDAETRCFVPAPDPGDIHMDAITDAIAAIIDKDDVPTQRRIIDHLSGVVPKHKIPTLLKRGEGERWTVGKGDKKSLIYSLANSVPQKPNLYIERGFGALKTGSQISEQTGESQGSQPIDLTLFPSSPDCPKDVGAQDILTLAAEDFEGGLF